MVSNNLLLCSEVANSLSKELFIMINECLREIEILSEDVSKENTKAAEKAIIWLYKSYPKIPQPEICLDAKNQFLFIWISKNGLRSLYASVSESEVYYTFNNDLQRDKETIPHIDDCIDLIEKVYSSFC